MSASEPTRPAYMRPLADLIAETREKLRAGTVHQATVAHDNWCGIWAGRVCNCNPQITLAPIHSPESN
jgi:hypothetical protein